MSDLIERSAVLDLMRTNWADNDGDTAMQLSIDDVRNLPAAAAENAVSRQAVLDGLVSIAKAKAKSDAQKALMGRVMFFAEHLPPVTPKPRTGKWIPTQHFDEWYCPTGECSNCGIEHILGLPYCPRCGAKMEGVSE